jgi:hypothetical protein
VTDQYPRKPQAETPEQWVWDHLEQKPSGCWEVEGIPRDRDGYGRVSIAPGQRTGAHRIMFEEAYGPLPPDRPHVLHHCDNPPCCRPTHLFAGTQSDNDRDRHAKGRTRGTFRAGGTPDRHPRWGTKEALRD